MKEMTKINLVFKYKCNWFCRFYRNEMDFNLHIIYGYRWRFPGLKLTELLSVSNGGG